MKTDTLNTEDIKLYDVQKIREDFPILKKLIHGKPLCYLDNAATSQKPQVVIDAINNFYLSQNANVHRGVHKLSEEEKKIWEDLKKIISEVAKVPIEAIDWNKNILMDFGIESIVGIQILAAVEDRFNVNVPEKDAARLLKIEDMVKAIKQYRRI